MPDLHFALSASQGKIWSACTRSYMAGKDFPDKGGNFAAEGTYAHSMAEYIMSRFVAGTPNPDDLTNFDTDNEFYSPAMVEYVHQYTDLCSEKVIAARKSDKFAACLVEQQLHFNSIVEGGFGTGDMVIIADNELNIIDLKYGKGVPVSAEENVQLQIYAVGAIEQFGFAYEGRGFELGFIHFEVCTAGRIIFQGNDDILGIGVSFQDGSLYIFSSLVDGYGAREVGRLYFDFFYLTGSTIYFHFIALQRIRHQIFQLEFVIISLGTGQDSVGRNDFGSSIFCGLLHSDGIAGSSKYRGSSTQTGQSHNAGSSDSNHLFLHRHDKSSSYNYLLLNYYIPKR